MLLEKIRKYVVPLALAAGVLCAGIGAWWDIRAAKIQQGIAAQVIRFHVLADSDSAWDQANKLAVRDTVLDYLNDVLPENMNVVQTANFIENHLKNIRQVAEETLAQRDCSDPVQARLVQDDFPEKTYGDCTFPAGTYEALRISIGRALASYPELIICDEPVSALDVAIQAQILNLLLDLQEHFGLTYLIITHDLNVLRYISDRIAVMYLGKLMEFGPTETISSNPLHPYTHGLMAASPILDPTLRNQKKELMGGETGSLINLPKGCRFAARCPHATDRCREELPKDYHVDALHQVSCFLYDK